MSRYPDTPWTLDGAENIMSEITAIDVNDAQGFEVCTIPGTAVLSGWPELTNAAHWADKPGETFIEREPEQILALARLFAAAPQLRAALEACLRIGLREGEEFDSEGFIKLGTPQQKRAAEITAQARAALALANEPADGDE